MAAFCFDRAVAVFGSTVQAELDEAANKAKTDTQARNKQAMILRRWLDSGEQKFRDPAAPSKE